MTEPFQKPVGGGSLDEPFYIDLAKTRKATTWTLIYAATQRIQEYFRAIERRFVEREPAIRQIMHAMMLREHIMLDGPSGTGKSFLVRTVFSGILDAMVWAMDLSQFTTETNLFGSYDVRKMRDTGKMEHMTDDSLADANFAQTGEFFDANDAALRLLLGALNERVVRKGPQIIRLPLITTVADTNFHPDMLAKGRRERLEAVIDRFMFRVTVGYVQDPRNRLAMLQMSLEDVHVADLPPVSLEDFVLVSGAILGMNLVRDPYVAQAYEELTRRYSQKRVEAGGLPLSDRRFVRGAHIMELYALLAGRRDVTFDDLEATGNVLAHTDKERELLDSVRREVIDGWIGRASRREIENELHRLGEITGVISAQVDLTAMPFAELQRLATQIDEAITQLDKFETTLIEVGKQQLESSQRLHGLRNQIDLRLLEEIEKLLPTIPERPDEAQLGVLVRQVNIGIGQLRGLQPRSESVLNRKSQLLERAFRDRENLRTAFGLAGQPVPEEEAV